MFCLLIHKTFIHPLWACQYAKVKSAHACEVGWLGVRTRQEKFKQQSQEAMALMRGLNEPDRRTTTCSMHDEH